MNLGEARQLLGAVRSRLLRGRLKRDPGTRLLGAERHGVVMTLWTETGKLVVEDKKVTVIRREM